MLQITTTYTIAEVKEFIREALKVELSLLQNKIATKKEVKIYSLKEASAILKVHRTTLYDWNEKGKLRQQKTASKRVYYLAEDIDNFYAKN